jgi:hypothetical protein
MNTMHPLARALLVSLCALLMVPLMGTRTFAIDVEIQSVVFSEDYDTAVITLSRYLSGRAIPIAFNIYTNEKKVIKGGRLVVARERAEVKGFRQIFDDHGGEDVYWLKFAVCPEEDFQKSQGITSACGTPYEIGIYYSPERFAADCTIERTKAVGTVFTFEILNEKTKEGDDVCKMGQYLIFSFPANGAQVLAVDEHSILVRTIPSASFYLFIQRNGQTISYYESGLTGTTPTSEQRRSKSSSRSIELFPISAKKKSKASFYSASSPSNESPR